MTTCLPSKVLHIRNLPEECTEMDIRAVSAPFGNIRQILFLSQKQQAFVEFSTMEEAAMMLATCQTNVIRMGSRCPILDVMSISSLIPNHVSFFASQESCCSVLEQTRDHHSCTTIDRSFHRCGLSAIESFALTQFARGMLGN
jgi:RNA recognition motif-containing protein